MKKTLVVAVSVLGMLAACSPKGDVTVAFRGQTPVNATGKKGGADPRSVEFLCPSCGTVVASDTQRCPSAGCKAAISWAREDRVCGYCRGTGACAACEMMNQTDGACYNCGGKGFLSIQGKAPLCPNCKGSKKCVACGAGTPGKCDFCEGKGLVALTALKGRARHTPEESVKE